MTSFEFMDAVANNTASSQDYLDQANAMAVKFYAAMGYKVKSDYRMYEARHPQELMCWRMAEMVMTDYFSTDMDDVIADLL